MKVMIYKNIVFDDFVDNTEEYDSYYVEMCPYCYNKYKNVLDRRVDDGGAACGTCSVKSCENESDYYVDFDMNEVSFRE